MRIWTRSLPRSSSGTIRSCGAGRCWSGGGVVVAASYEAKAFGIRTPMGVRQARGCARRPSSAEPHFEAYSEASKAVFDIFEHTTPLVGGLSIDEAFLDVRGMEQIAGTPVEIAARLRSGGPRAGRPAHHGRHRAHQAPGQGRQRGGQARRSPARTARRGDRVFAPAGGRAPVGRWPRHRPQAPRAGPDDRRPGGGEGEETLVSLLGKPPATTCMPWRTTRIPAGPRRPPQRLDRLAERARQVAQSARAHRRHAAGDRRPRDAPHAHGQASRPHRDAAPALRRLHTRHTLAHAGLADRPDPPILATVRDLMTRPGP